LKLLTNSAISAQSCLRRYYLSYEIGIKRDRSTTPLRMGIAIHRGLEFGTVEAGIEGYDVEPEWCISPEDVLAWTVEREKVKQILTAYFAYWQDDACVSAVKELEFCIPLRNPKTGRPSRGWMKAGKIDDIVTVPDGRMAIFETKSTGQDISLGSDYWRKLTMDIQISIYLLAAQELGYPVVTTLYNVIKTTTKKPKLIKKVRETVDEFGARLASDIRAEPEKHFIRQEIPRLKADIEETKYDLWNYQRMLTMCARQGFWPRNPRQCLSPWRCQFFDFCAQGWKQGDRLPEGFIYGKRHPELVAKEE